VTGPTFIVPGAVLFVADLARAHRFYGALTGWRASHEDAHHVVLRGEGFELVLHQLRGEPVPAADASGRAPTREDSYWKLCLPVAGIALARSAMAAHGGHLRGPDAEWEGRGFRACDGQDPEGNVIQVREAIAPGAGTPG